MVLHKQLRVLHVGTPCCIINKETDEVVNESHSDKALESLRGTPFYNAFVKDVCLVTSPSVRLNILVKRNKNER